MFVRRNITLFSVAAVLASGCGGDDTTGNSGAATEETDGRDEDGSGSESADESADEGQDSQSGSGESVGDGDSNSGGDGDSNSGGDGDSATGGDGDSASGGDGDSATGGDGDSGTGGDGDSGTGGDGDSGTGGDGDGGSGSGSGGGDGDGDSCTDECPTIGETSCADTNTLQTCILDTVTTCNIWGQDTDCSAVVANGVCDSGNPPTEPAACIDGCADVSNQCDTPGATQCMGETLQTCTSTGGNPSCDVWVDTDCTTAVPLGTCEDNAPSECVQCGSQACTPGETLCQGNTLLTCVADATTGCGDWDNGVDCTDTPGGQGVCVDGDPDACDDPCDGLPNLCTATDTYQCDSSNEDYVEACTAGTNGCLQWQFDVDCVVVENDLFGECDLLEPDNCDVPEGCFAEQPTPTFDPPNLPLVLDHSGSMYNVSFGTYPTRWAALIDTVDATVDAYDDQINFGVKWFPTNDTTCASPEGCQVDPGFDVAPAPNNYDNIMTPLNALINPPGTCYTPTESAWKETYDALQAGYAGESNAIMLVIDGGISCTGESHTELVDAIENVADETPTYVVGIGTSGTTAENANQYAVVGNGQRPEQPTCFTQETINLGAGNNVITFRYEKNGSALDYADFVWIDDVQVTANGTVFSDDFESGTLAAEWSNGGNANWRFNQTTSYEGNWSMRSGYIQNSQTSDLILTVNLSQAGTLTFRQRVETQSGNDYLRVLVNNNQQIQRSGTAGCGPLYFETDNPAELNQSMSDIAQSVITCDIDLGVAPPFGDEVDVVVDNVQYPRLDSNLGTFDCANQDGWYYTDESTTTCETDVPFACDRITLCGAACTGFKALTTPTADVTYFCDAG